MHHKGPEEVIVSLKTYSALYGRLHDEELVEMLGDNAMILLNYMTFDKNMRLVEHIPTIEGWDFEIKHLNYDIPHSAKRQRTS